MTGTEATPTNAVVDERDAIFAKPHSDQLTGTSVRGGAVTLAGQAFSFFAQTASMMILARLLSPTDFGISGMAAAVTGFLAMFGDIGLGAVTIQRKEITHREVSTLFWINLSVGATLALVTVALAPALVAFYNEPRLYWVMNVSALSFLLSGLRAQHAAILYRTMRFGAIAKIGIVSLGISSIAGIGMAALGFGYWSLIVMAVSNSLISVIAHWIVVGWRPSKPVRGCGIRSMMQFGGTVTLNGFVVYIAYNIEKVLLGRSFGAAPLGVYGRAYQLLNLPLQQLYAAMYSVAFPGLSAMQDSNERLCRAFLKGYAVLLAFTLPLIMASALFAEEIVQIVLGPNWAEVIPILRLLTPAILIFAIINPYGWFLVATGRAGRSLRMALAIAPIVITGILIGIKWGPEGVALGYSVAMCSWVVPHTLWAFHDTGIRMRDYWSAAQSPLLAALLAMGCGLVVKMSFAHVLNPILMFAIGMTICMAVYGWILAFPLRQKELYLGLIRQFTQRFNVNRSAVVAK